MDKHERLRAARIAAGFQTAAAAAKRHGWNATAYRHHENGTAGFPRQVETYAKAFRVAPEWLLFGRGEAPLAVEDFTWNSRVPVTGRIPVLGTVQAGVWREGEAFDVSEATEFVPLKIPGYDTETLFALKVGGTSMNLVFPEGRFIIIAPAAEAGVREGDYVVVRRARNGLSETTVKQIAMEGGRVALWPRSTDPAYQQPIYITGEDGDQDAPEIVGVVIADYSKIERGPGALAIPPSAIK